MLLGYGLNVTEQQLFKNLIYEHIYCFGDPTLPWFCIVVFMQSVKNNTLVVSEKTVVHVTL